MNYVKFKLTDFDLEKLEVVKETIMWLDGQDHSRWVLKSSANYTAFGGQELYLKIWNPTYIRRDNILAANDVGFYDEQITPAMVGLIFHKNICRGYVVKKCTRNWGSKVDEHFFDLIKKKSEQTGYFSYQFSRFHVMRYKRRQNLIDLEGVYPIEQLPTLPKYQSRFDDRKYEDFIIGLYNDRYAHQLHKLQFQPNRTEGEFSKPNLLKRSMSFFWRQSMSLWKRRKTDKSHHLHLINCE